MSVGRAGRRGQGPAEAAFEGRFESRVAAGRLAPARSPSAAGVRVLLPPAQRPAAVCARRLGLSEVRGTLVEVRGVGTTCWRRGRYPAEACAAQEAEGAGSEVEPGLPPVTYGELPGQTRAPGPGSGARCPGPEREVNPTQSRGANPCQAPLLQGDSYCY